MQSAAIEGFEADGVFGVADFDSQSFAEIGHRRRRIELTVRQIEIEPAELRCLTRLAGRWNEPLDPHISHKIPVVLIIVSNVHIQDGQPRFIASEKFHGLGGLRIG